MPRTDEARDPEANDLLSHMIRSACVNDGTVQSGHEDRNADIVTSVLGAALDVEQYEPAPGRRSVVARITGSDPSAPTLMLVGHTDVVPVLDPDTWHRDPFGGEIVDGEIWGRGAIDMLNQTAAMALTVRRLADEGWRPRGTLVFAAVADEEAGSSYGVEYLLAEHRDSVAADYVITETGGFPLPGPDGIRLPVVVGEKGAVMATVRVSGTSGHASQPLRTDNALVTAAEVVRRISAYRPQTDIHETWRAFVEGMAFPDEIAAKLLSADDLDGVLDLLPLGMARQAHACTHTTFAPTMIEGPMKLNVIPDTIDLHVDVRTLPGHRARDVEAMLRDAVGDDLGDRVRFETARDDESTMSPRETPMWDTITRVSSRFYPGSRVLPFVSVGATDARWFRRAGAVGYGFALFSTDLGIDDFGARFHGDDERIDEASLSLTARCYDAIARDLLG